MFTTTIFCCGEHLVSDRFFEVIPETVGMYISALANPMKDVLTIIVVDNNGGGIFSTLPQRGVNGFEKVFGTPHNQDLAKIVAGFGISLDVPSHKNTFDTPL